MSGDSVSTPALVSFCPSSKDKHISQLAGDGRILLVACDLKVGSAGGSEGTTIPVPELEFAGVTVTNVDMNVVCSGGLELLEVAGNGQ